tara:strand:- start:8 stop:1003 length:996 start_codon:yes stop_codon:yes gene_type:complete
VIVKSAKQKGKTCSKCKETKSSSEFYKNNASPNGLCSICKPCKRSQSLCTYEKNKEKVKRRTNAYYQKNKEEIGIRNRAWYDKNKEKVKTHRHAYYEKNKEEISRRNKVWHEKNKKKNNLKSKAYYEKNKEKLVANSKIWNEKNKEKVKIYRKGWLEDNKERLTAKAKVYYKKNKKRIRAHHKIYVEKNKDRLNASSRAKRKKRYQTEPLFKLTVNVRNLINSAIKDKGYTKRSKASEILGCTFEFFLSYLKKQLEEGMSLNDTHLDHIVPLNLGETEEEIIALNHYSNFRPLPGKENLSKRDKLILSIVSPENKIKYKEIIERAQKQRSR